MPQEGESTPQDAQAAPATEEGQEPTGTTKDGPTTFDADYVKTLRAEAAKHRREATEAKARVQQYEERDQSETEKLAGKITKAEQGRAEAEAKLLRFEVAAEKQVPAKLLPLLTASSKEDLEMQADLLLENAKPPTPDFDGGPREPASDPKPPAEAHNDLISALLHGTQNT